MGIEGGGVGVGGRQKGRKESYTYIAEQILNEQRQTMMLNVCVRGGSKS